MVVHLDDKLVVQLVEMTVVMLAVSMDDYMVALKAVQLDSSSVEKWDVELAAWKVGHLDNCLVAQLEFQMAA